MQTKKFRAFFAIDLPENVKHEVTHLVTLLKKSNPNKNISWVRPENLHITLKFLGNVTESQCEQFLPEVKTIISQWRKFEIRLNKLILFPSKRKPRVIALLPSPLEQLVALTYKIEEQVINYDVQVEAKSFKPHLTLARIKDKDIREINEVAVPSLAFVVQRITLFCSEITHAGSRYIPLQHLSLSSVYTIRQ